MFNYDLDCGDRVKVSGNRGTIIWVDCSGYYVEFDKAKHGANIFDLCDLTPLRRLSAPQKRPKQKA